MYTYTSYSGKMLGIFVLVFNSVFLYSQTIYTDLPDSVRQSHISTSWKAGQIKQYLLTQTLSIEAAEKMKIADKWDNAGNIFFIAGGASLVTGGVVAATANSQEQLAWGLVIMLSSALWSGAGSLCYMVSGYYFNQAVSIYLHPVKTTNGYGLNLRLRF